MGNKEFKKEIAKLRKEQRDLDRKFLLVMILLFGVLVVFGIILSCPVHQ